jgi:hypothetical protein
MSIIDNIENGQDFGRERQSCGGRRSLLDSGGGGDGEREETGRERGEPHAFMGVGWTKKPEENQEKNGCGRR